jgi:hypothetical protein
MIVQGPARMARDPREFAELFLALWRPFVNPGRREEDSQARI